MKPSQFKKLAAPRNFDEDTNSLKHIQTAIQNGKPIGSPFLSVTFDPKHKKPALITGHEGRTRMEAIQKVHGDVPVLVHIFPGGGDRARHISAAHIQAFQQGAIPEKQTKVIAGPHFGDDVHHLGKWQDINQMKHKSHASTEFPEMEHIELKANHSHTGGRVKEYAVHTKRGRHLGTIYNSDLVDQPQTTWQALYKGKFTEHPSIEHAAVHIFKKAKPAKWEMKANVMKTIADDVPISNDHNEMAAHHLQKMQTAKSAMKAEPNVATHKTTYKYHKAMFNKHNNLYKMRLANKYSMKQIQQSHANTDVRNLEVDAGILDHAKAAYHIIKSNIHHDAATKHLGIYNKLKQNFTSDPGDAVEKKNAMAHHLSVFNAHKAMHKEHLNAYHKASNWRRLDRIEPTLDKPKTAAPKVTPENKSVAPAVETPPKKIGPKPYRPPAEPDTSKLKDAALHNTMIKYHEDAANNTTSGIGKRYHNEEIDKHKTALQNIKPKAVKLKPAAPVKPAEPVNTKNKQDADYEKLSSKEKKKHNDETIQYHNTMIKHHGDEIKKNVKKLAADPKNTKAAQAIEYHNAERKEFTDNVQKYHKANNDLADTPANEPDSDKANIKHHTTELRKHQALVKKHTKTVDGLKAALTDPDTAKDVKKKQRDALKEHNGHLKNAKHNVNHHAKILESYGVPDSKINPVAKQTEPKVAKPVQKAVPVKSAPVKAAPKSRYVQKTEPTPPPPPVKKKYKLKVVPQAVSTKRRNRAA